MTKSIKKGKRLTGVVVAAGRMAKTVTVEVRRFVKHPKYGKYEVKREKYLVHDETGQAKVGDKVQIQATRPLSRRKHFVLI
jgi:small subunit ribosomal protein S17